VIFKKIFKSAVWSMIIHPLRVVVVGSVGFNLDFSSYPVSKSRSLQDAKFSSLICLDSGNDWALCSFLVRWPLTTTAEVIGPGAEVLCFYNVVLFGCNSQTRHNRSSQLVEYSRCFFSLVVGWVVIGSGVLFFRELLISAAVYERVVAEVNMGWGLLMSGGG